jgi:hypothetical protein
MKTVGFEGFGGVMAILAGVAGFLYAMSFVILRTALLYELFFTLFGFFATAAWLAVYDRLRDTDAGFAAWAALLGLAAALAAALQGGYGLANAINPPPAGADVLALLPSQVDPRGLLAFGFGGAALLVASRLMARSGRFPPGLSTLGYVSGVLLVIIYLGRLIVLDPSSPLILVPVVLNGFIAGPVWFIWLGLVLSRPGLAHAPVLAR